VTAGLIRIGTRGSALALVQARLAAESLEQAGYDSDLVILETEGDRRSPDTAWGEGAFVKAIEHALLAGRVDLAVHSAKDVPTDEDPRLVIGAYLERADARDALVTDVESAASLASLPPGSRVGTDSPRRTGFLLAARPDLRVHPLHGNVDTRLRRLEAGEADGLILASAGLDRLGHAGRITERLDTALMPPAPGQGALALQVRADDTLLRAATAAIDHWPTRVAVESERAFLRASGGGCRSPIGAYAVVAGGRLTLLGGHARPDGTEAAIERASGPVAEAGAIARALSERFVRDGMPIGATR
jgi:hydroxymethylbilane synthase